MALDKNKLKTGFFNWLRNVNDYPNPEGFAIAFADAYESYALDAQDISGDNPLSLNKTAMINLLKLIVQPGTPVNAALQYELALIAFWTGATFKLDTPPLGTIAPEVSAIVTTPPIPGSIAPIMTTLLSDLSLVDPQDPDSTYDKKATDYSDLFDVVTHTIIVTCVGTNAAPPPPVLPVLGPIT